VNRMPSLIQAHSVATKDQLAFVTATHSIRDNIYKLVTTV